MRALEAALWLGCAACVNDIDFTSGAVSGGGASSESASSGVSGSGAGGPCSPDALFQGAPDGCASNALCFRAPLPDGGVCTQQPCPGKCSEALPCPEDGFCDPGTNGALCNDGLFPQKDKVCIVSVCLTPANCPPSFQCVGVNAVFAAGLCSSGAPGQPCTQNSECWSGNCVLFGPVGACF